MIRNIIFYLGYFYFHLILKTCTAVLKGREILEGEWAQNKPVVFCSPHNLLLCLFAGVEIGKLKRPPITLVASLSDDGELISKLLHKFRYTMVRGSSRRGGAKAMLELARAGKEGKSLGLAFDGPKGPPLIPKRGLIGCARANTGELFFIHGKATANKFFPFLKPFRVNSWDKFLVPVPFCHIEIYFEKIPTNKDLSNSEKESFILNYIEKRSKEEFGDLYS